MSRRRNWKFIVPAFLIATIAVGSYFLYPINNTNRHDSYNYKAKMRGVEKNRPRDVGKTYTRNKNHYKTNQEYVMARKGNKNLIYSRINKALALEGKEQKLESFLRTICSKDEILIKLDQGVDAERIAAKYGAKVKQTFDGYGYAVITIKKGDDINQVISKMKRDDKIGFVRACLLYELQSIPNDTYFKIQWGLKRIQGELAHDIEVNSDVKVAVIDTGVDVTHPDLRGKIVDGFDVVKRTRAITDPDGHGTHVAGIIGATTNNAMGVSGTTTRIKIMPVPVFHFEGSAGAYLASEEHIVQGVDYARTHGAHVINMSLGGSENSPLIAAAVGRAVNSGVTVVAATGNDGYAKVSFPGALPEVIGVGAVNESNGLASFSNYGSGIDVVAPGVNIRSTLPWRAGRYLSTSGTSMATPFVTGLAAMVKAKFPGYTPAQIKARIQATATDLGKPGWDPEYGSGLVNAYRALGGTGVALPKAVKGDPLEGAKNNNSPSTATLVKYPTTITSGYFGPTSDADWYRIRGVKGTNITVTLKTDVSTGANGVIEIYKAGNYAVPVKGSDTNEGSLEEINYTFPSNGDYYIKAFDFKDTLGVTSYTLDIASTPVIAPFLLITNKLINWTHINWFRVFVPKGNFLNISVDGPGNFDGQLIIYDNANLPLMETNNSPKGIAEVSSYRAAADGYYVVGVKQTLDNNNLLYNLKVNISNEPKVLTPLNTQVNGMLTRPYDARFYKLNFTNSGRYQVMVKPLVGFNPVLQLYQQNPKGRRLITTQNKGKKGQAEVLSLNIKKKGIYYLGIQDAQGLTSLVPFKVVTTFNPAPILKPVTLKTTFLPKKERLHRIPISLNESGVVTLQVYRGTQLIKSLFTGTVNKQRLLTWNGKGRNNRRVASGIYNYRITVRDSVTGAVSAPKVIRFNVKE